MKLLSEADVVLALGTRLGPFGTLPQHGLDYWPKNARIIQVDADHRMLGLVRPVSVGICGDAAGGGGAGGWPRASWPARPRAERARADRIISEKSAWKRNWTAGRTSATTGAWTSSAGAAAACIRAAYCASWNWPCPSM